MIQAYVVFMFAIVVLGLSVICVAALSILLCEGAGWIWSYLSAHTPEQRTPALAHNRQRV